MLLQTNSYVVPNEKRAEHARVIRRFRQALLRLGCDQFEVYEQVGANWSPSEGHVRFVQLMRFRDRRQQQAVQAAERDDPMAQRIIAEFCDLVNLPYQQENGFFAVGFYTSVLPIGPRRVAEEEHQEQEAPTEFDQAGLSAVQDLAAAETLAPAEELAPVEDLAPAEDLAPVEELAPAEEVTPVEELAPAEELMPVEHVSTAEELVPVEGLSAAEELEQIEQLLAAQDAIANDDATGAFGDAGLPAELPATGLVGMQADAPMPLGSGEAATQEIQPAPAFDEIVEPTGKAPQSEPLLEAGAPADAAEADFLSAFGGTDELAPEAPILHGEVAGAKIEDDEKLLDLPSPEEFDAMIRAQRGEQATPIPSPAPVADEADESSAGGPDAIDELLSAIASAEEGLSAVSGDPLGEYSELTPDAGRSEDIASLDDEPQARESAEPTGELEPGDDAVKTLVDEQLSEAVASAAGAFAEVGISVPLAPHDMDDVMTAHEVFRPQEVPAIVDADSAPADSAPSEDDQDDELMELPPYLGDGSDLPESERHRLLEEHAGRRSAPGGNGFHASSEHAAQQHSGEQANSTMLEPEADEAPDLMERALTDDAAFEELLRSENMLGDGPLPDAGLVEPEDTRRGSF